MSLPEIRKLIFDYATRNTYYTMLITCISDHAVEDSSSTQLNSRGEGDTYDFDTFDFSLEVPEFY